VQEVGLGKELFVYCGPHVVEWSLFMNAIGDLDRIGGRSLPLTWAIDGLNKLKDMRSDQQLSTGPMRGPFLLNRALDFAGYGCTNPKDQFFGLLAISSDGGRVHADYSESLSDILINVAFSASDEGLADFVGRDYGYVLTKLGMSGDHMFQMLSDVGRKETRIPLWPKSVPQEGWRSYRDLRKRYLYVPDLTHSSHSYQLGGSRHSAKTLHTDVPYGTTDYDSGGYKFRVRKLNSNQLDIIGGGGRGIDNRYDIEEAVQAGEIQLCKSHRVGSFPARFTSSMSYPPTKECRLGLHVSGIATLLLLDNAGERADARPDIVQRIQVYRQKYPMSDLCTCKVSEEQNREALRLFDTQVEERKTRAAEEKAAEKRIADELNRKITNICFVRVD